MKYAYGGGINSTWYLGFEMEGDKVLVLLHDRLHNERDTDHPKCEPGLSFEMIETNDGKRTATGVVFSKHCDGHWHETKHELVNPGYVFGFPTFKA